MSSLTGTARLVWIGARAGWPWLLGVVVLSAGLVTAVAGSIDALYGTLAERQQYAATLGESPATQAFNGRGYGLDTIGGIAAYEVGFLGQLLFPILAFHLGLRHTRRDEEAGRTELITAARVGRLAPLASGAILSSATFVIASALMFAGSVASELPAAGSAWYAACNAALMLFFGAVGLVLGQLMQSSRTGYLAGLAVVTVAYLIRALIDGLGVDAAWASPLGWLAEVRAFSDPQGWPLAAFGVGAALLTAAAAAIAHRRDLGAGVIAPRPGPERAARGFGSVVGVAWRLNQAAIGAWATLAVAWAAIFGALTREMSELIEDNPTMLEALGVERGSDVVMSLAVVVVCLAATATAVQGFDRLASEESSGRLGALLSTQTGRSRLWLQWWAVVTVAATAVLALGCLALGLATWAVVGDVEVMRTAAELATGYAVPVAFVATVAASLRAIRSGIGSIAWLLVGWIAIVGFLAETLRLPQWSRDLSPLHLAGPLPGENLRLVTLSGLAVGTGLLLTLSVVAFTRRDITAG